MSAIAHVPPDSTIDDICSILNRDAAVIVDDAISAPVLHRLRAEIDPHLHAASPGDNEFGGYRTRRVGALIARSETCRELAMDARVNAVAQRVLGPFSDGYQLHFSQAVSIGPGEVAQVLHRDRGVWDGRVPRRIETQLSTIWAITEFTTENGATRVAPGSQHWPRDREPEEGELVAATMAAGSVLLYTGTVLHGGGANTTEHARIGVLLHYTLSWLRQEENQYLSCPPDIARYLSPDVRRLIGYSKGGPVLGFYSDPTAPGEGGREQISPEQLFDRAP